MSTTSWERVAAGLRDEPRSWLVTGAAGFIGSHLLQTLLELDQTVTGLDDFSTGSRKNLTDVERAVGPERAARLRFLEADIRDLAACHAACEGAERVLHQAALGSVPRSIADPLRSHAANVDGFLNMLVAARDAGCARFVYASSSSVYGDHPELPKREDRTGSPLSPYAATKCVDELYAAVFARTYGLQAIGLRYFNVFGPRQDPEGPYAAVIPRWIETLLAGEAPLIHGDGETSRDFCPVANAVRANLLAALAEPAAAQPGAAYNVALGGRTSLNELFGKLRAALAERGADVGAIEPQYDDFRPGDVRHSLADLARVSEHLGYEPAVDVDRGLADTVEWFLRRPR